jgi:hypothetical protein
MAGFLLYASYAPRETELTKRPAKEYAPHPPQNNWNRFLFAGKNLNQ